MRFSSNQKNNKWFYVLLKNNEKKEGKFDN